MKTIGLIGGMSWESSLEYYRIINEAVKERLGGLHSGEVLMYSVDFGPIEELMRQGDWKEISSNLISIAKKLETGGAECLVVCTNTMHKMADEIQESINIPLLHIADAAAVHIKKEGLRKVALLGTRFTMEEEFYRERLQNKHDIKDIIPDKEGVRIVDDAIFKELCLGIIKEDSKEDYLEVIKKLITEGAEGIILGCTEIPLLVKPEDV